MRDSFKDREFGLNTDSLFQFFSSLPFSVHQSLFYSYYCTFFLLEHTTGQYASDNYYFDPPDVFFLR